MARCGTDVLKERLAQGARPEVWVRFPRQLGDVIFTLPFLGSLQAAWNAAAAAQGIRLRWVAVGHAIGAGLFSEANPDFIAESVIESGGEGKPDPFHLLRRWRQAPPVAVLNLSQSVRLALAAWLARVPIRAGDVDNHLGLLYHHRFTYRGLPIHISRRFEPLLEQLTGARSLTWLAVTPERFGGHRGLDSLRSAGWRGGPFITLAFGTRGYTKRWFPERETWPTLAKRFLQEGFEVVWLGGPDEVPLGRELAELAPGSLNLAGQTSLPEACALQYHAYGNVAIDTGLAHTAAGTGRPTITLIGDSPETLINPQGPRALSVRGAEVELGEPARFETYGSSAHRLTPARVANLLHALAAEAAGRTITPALG